MAISLGYLAMHTPGTDPLTGGPMTYRCYIIADTEAELPSSGLRQGDLAFVKASNKTMVATSTTTWVQTNGGGGSGINYRLAASWFGTVIKTNIGTAFAAIFLGLNGQRLPFDFAGFTQVRVIARWQVIGTGTQNVRVIESGTANLLADLSTSGAGEKELDSGWVAKPAWATDGEKWLVVQGKSTVAADDPVFRDCVVLVR